MLSIARCTIHDIAAAPNCAQVLAEYASESAVLEIGPASAQFETYYALESAGVLHPIAAFDGPLLAGVVLILATKMPHYSVMTATTESFFVSKVYRPSNLGLRLLAYAEATAADLGAGALMISTPVGGALAAVMRRIKSYRHSNEVFVKKL